jgi:hypothetical protein
MEESNPTKLPQKLGKEITFSSVIHQQTRKFISKIKHIKQNEKYQHQSLSFHIVKKFALAQAIKMMLKAKTLLKNLDHSIKIKNKNTGELKPLCVKPIISGSNKQNPTNPM